MLKRIVLGLLLALGLGPASAQNYTALVGPSPQLRLTLTTGVPVLSAAVDAATTVYYTPYFGNIVPLYNGNVMVPVQCAEISNVLANSATDNAGPAAAVANSVYDLYVWSNAGVCTLTRSPAWTSVNIRGTGAGTAEQVRTLGMLTNKQNISNGPAATMGTYVGTIMTDAGGVTVTFDGGGNGAGGAAATFGVWNMYNRVPANAAVGDTSAGWTYSTNAIRSADNSTTNRVTFVVGETGETSVAVNYRVYVTAPAATNSIYSIGTSDNATNTLDGVARVATPGTNANVMSVTLQSSYLYSPLNFGNPGQQFIQATERGDGTNTFTVNSIGNTSYLFASLMM